MKIEYLHTEFENMRQNSFRLIDKNDYFTNIWIQITTDQVKIYVAMKTKPNLDEQNGKITFIAVVLLNLCVFWLKGFGFMWGYLHLTPVFKWVLSVVVVNYWLILFSFDFCLNH